jgi:cytosine/adenosine deaminase-related metal-dependent hydrolase
VIFATNAQLPEGSARNVRISQSGGLIDKVTPGATAQPGDIRVSALLPALSNLHSHSFQRALAGMTEHRIAGRDSF